MDFRQVTLEKLVKHAIKGQLILLYFLRKTEEEVKYDVNRAIKNITTWLDLVLTQRSNPFNFKYEKFIAAEQEFNTNLYGVKGNIDSTIIIKDSKGNLKATALEIKTGKYKSMGYRGQVLLYSLIISERFMNSNPDNILLFIMDENLKDPSTQSFQYIKQTKNELDSIIIGRNELAKWYKRNNTNPSLGKWNESLGKFRVSREVLQIRKQQNFGEFGFNFRDQGVDIEDFGPEEGKDDEAQNGDEPLIVQYPPMINRTSECKGCYQKKVCSVAALAIEDANPLAAKRTGTQGQFPFFLEMQAKLAKDIKVYFKQFIECINLEQNAENEKLNGGFKT